MQIGKFYQNEGKHKLATETEDTILSIILRFVNKCSSDTQTYKTFVYILFQFRNVNRTFFFCILKTNISPFFRRQQN